MEKVNQAYIDAFIIGILSTPKIAGLSFEEKDKVKQQLEDHFNNFILETLLNRVGESELQEIRKAVQNPVLLEQKLQDYAASVPGFAEDLHARLEREFAFIRSNFE